MSGQEAGEGRRGAVGKAAEREREEQAVSERSGAGQAAWERGTSSTPDSLSMACFSSLSVL